MRSKSRFAPIASRRKFLYHKESSMGELNTLYVGNLNYKASKEDLESLFGEFGEVAKVRLIEKDGIKKGFGFVEFAESAAAKKSKDELDGQEFMGRRLKIDFALPKKPRE